MLKKINKLHNWQIAVILIIVGFSVYSAGLNNPFQGDDINQIVNNIPVHSISNIKLFFEGSTFYNGGGLTPLVGVYFKPLMTVTFSLIYTIFGPHQLYFHLFMLLLGIANAFLLYLIFRYSFSVLMALILGLIFLVHPLNSQVIYAIPSMQDELYFFFGVLALYTLIRYRSTKSMLVVAILLFLSILSKESGILFSIMSLFYLFWSDKKRIKYFLATMVLPAIIYLYLRINAVGLLSKQTSSPIDKLNFTGRLLTAPSIPIFYLTKFIFPWKLASGYYWTNPNFSINHVLLPLIGDLLLALLVIYIAFKVHEKASKSDYYTYLFFAVWTALSFLLIIQIEPLDMTASDIWFYFPMAGLLGMIGIILKTYQKHIKPVLFISVSLILIIAFGTRTFYRAFDWQSTLKIAQSDIKASPDDFNAYSILAKQQITDGNYNLASAYINKANNIYPDYNNYLDLGSAEAYQGKYSAAFDSYNQALKIGSNFSAKNLNGVYEDMGTLTVIYGSPESNIQFLKSALRKYPQDYLLWQDLALNFQKSKDNIDAKKCISLAVYYGRVNSKIYNNIMANKSFELNFGSTGKTINI